MGLIPRKERLTRKLEDDSRSGKRDYQGLVDQLSSPEAKVRRLGARDLSGFPSAAEVLGERLPQEDDLAVREAMFGSLVAIGGDAAVRCLIPMLKSEDAALRNSAVEALQQISEALAPYLEAMLSDGDADVRILAVNILSALSLPQSPELLLKAAAHDEHVNVVAGALDALAEVGTLEMVPILEEIKGRFPREPFLTFAVETAIRRIKG